ncbi:RidA family protein [candidate division KSB1 bacterium]
MEKIFTDSAPKPGGHYSQAVVHNGLVFVSGQLPIKPDTGEKITGDIKEQTKTVLNNIEAILTGSGSKKENVLKTTVYVSDISLWGDVNEVYADFFGEHKPARAVVPTRELHFGFLIEMEAVAFI